MPHDSTCMSGVKNPAERFCEVISGVQNASAMYELDFKSFFPVLDREIGYVNVSGTFSGSFRVDHLDGSHVVFEESGWSLHRETKVNKNGTEILGSLSGGNSSDEFCLRRACGSDGLSLRLVSNGGGGENERVPGGGTTLA